jgi:hypothetical protein
MWNVIGSGLRIGIGIWVEAEVGVWNSVYVNMV